MHYLALLASILFNGTSIVLLKAFAAEQEARDYADPRVRAATGDDPGAVGNRSRGGRDLRVRLRLILHPLVLLSMGCFAAAAVTWIMALSALPLSTAYPSMSIIYVLTALTGRLLFAERISVKRWTGIGLVVVGVTLLYAG